MYRANILPLVLYTYIACLLSHRHIFTRKPANKLGEFDNPEC